MKTVYYTEKSISTVTTTYVEIDGNDRDWLEQQIAKTASFARKVNASLDPEMQDLKAVMKKLEKHLPKSGRTGKNTVMSYLEGVFMNCTQVTPQGMRRDMTKSNIMALTEIWGALAKVSRVTAELQQFEVIHNAVQFVEQVQFIAGVKPKQLPRVVSLTDLVEF